MMRQLSYLMSLPWVIPHELSHFIVARLRTDDAAMEVEVLDAHAQASWTPLESRFWRAFAFLAPTVLGSILAALWIVRGVDLEGWRLIFAIGLALYTVPSPADVRGALGRQPAQTQQ